MVLGKFLLRFNEGENRGEEKSEEIDRFKM